MSGDEFLRRDLGEEIGMRVARCLIDLGCVQLSPSAPFTYASGLRGPIYCDNRKLLSHPEARKTVVEALEVAVAQTGAGTEILAGLATGGIAYAAFVAERQQRGMAYIRSRPKGHGRSQQIEGDCPKGSQLLLVEDLVNQASSLGEAIGAVRAAGLVTDRGVCLVDYRSTAGGAVLEKHNFSLTALTHFDYLVAQARASGTIDSGGEELLRDWHRDPQGWSEALKER